MKNGPYELIIAPEEYPGKKYRNRYAYEHTVVWWRNNGFVPEKGMEIHHINMDHRDNRIENLQLITSLEHKKLHGHKNKIEPIEFKCGFCDKLFKISKRILKSRIKQRKYGKIFCSTSCGAKHQHANQ